MRESIIPIALVNSTKPNLILDLTDPSSQNIEFIDLHYPTDLLDLRLSETVYIPLNTTVAYNCLIYTVGTYMGRITNIDTEKYNYTLETPNKLELIYVANYLCWSEKLTIAAKGIKASLVKTPK